MAGADSSSFEIIGSFTGDYVNPGESKTYTVQHKHGLSKGTYNETITILGRSQADFNKSATKELSLSFTVLGNEPNFTATPNSITFSPKDVGYGNDWQTITLKNTGEVTLNYSAVNPTYFRVNGLAGKYATSGNDITFDVAPELNLPVGNYNETLKITGTDQNNSLNKIEKEIQLSFTVTSSSTTTNMSADFTNVDFGTIEAGFTNEQAKTQLVRFTNTGTSTITLSNTNPTAQGPFSTYWYNNILQIAPGNYIDVNLRLDWESSFASVAGTYNGIYVFTATNTEDSSDTVTISIPAKVILTGGVHTHTYTLVPAKEPTCSAEGNNAYYTCTCGEVFKDASGSIGTTIADETLPIDANAHSWDAGTETTPATCTSEGVRTFTCQHNSGHTKTEPITKKAHTIVKVDAVAVDCETDGNIEYYKCTDCDKYFEDNSGTVEITDKSSVVIAKTGHNWGAWTQTIAPTQTTEGEEERVCQHNSAHKQTRPIPMLSHTHTLTKTDEVPATCETTGTKAYWTCSGCGRLFSDSTGTTEIDAPEVIAKTEHSWDAGTVTTPATCTSEGVKTYTCLHNSSHTKTETIAKKAHTLTAVTAVAPTCEVDGIKAHYKCSECNKTFEDALGNVEMTSIVDPATGHDWNEWVETTPATVDTTGTKERTCKHDSSHKETATIDKLALEITEGANKTYTLNSGAEVKIKCNGTFTNFDKLTSNGTEIADSNYDKESGSTVVTLKNSYLDSLSEGTYKLAFVYNDGRSAETNLTIAKASGNTNNENNNNEDVNKQEDSNTNNNQSSGTTENTSSITPKTGDSITLWIALLVVAALGTVGTVRYIRKRD